MMTDGGTPYVRAVSLAKATRLWASIGWLPGSLLLVRGSGLFERRI